MTEEKIEKEMAENIVESSGHPEEMKIEIDHLAIDEKAEEPKPKKKIIKRAPLEKVVDDSLKEINKLLDSEKPDVGVFENLFSKLEKEIQKKEVVYKMVKTYEKMKELKDNLDKVKAGQNLINTNSINNANNENKTSENIKETNNIEKENPENPNNNINKDIIINSHSEENPHIEKDINNNNNTNPNNIIPAIPLIDRNEILQFKNDFEDMKSILLKSKKPQENPQESSANKEGNIEIIVPLNFENNLDIINPEQDIQNNLIDGEPKKEEEKNESKDNKENNDNKEIKSPKKVKKQKKLKSLKNNTLENNNNSSNNNGQEGDQNSENKSNNNITNTTKKEKKSKKQEDKNNVPISKFFQRKEIPPEKPKSKEDPENLNVTGIQDNSNIIITNISELNKSQLLSIENQKIIYNNTLIEKSSPHLPDSIKSFYSLNSESITALSKSSYMSSLISYFKDLNILTQVNPTQLIPSSQKPKLIYIHNCFMPMKKIPETSSSKINPRNPLAKDEYLIDYEKDSEDEFEEENAEDIKSNDNEDKEEDEEDDNKSQPPEQQDDFIVPDGHLSEEEISDKEMIEERKLFEKSKGKILDIMDILGIRKNFNKPVIIDFRKENCAGKNNFEKIGELTKKLTIGIVNFIDNGNSTDDEEEMKNTINNNTDNNLINNNNSANNNGDIIDNINSPTKQENKQEGEDDEISKLQKKNILSFPIKFSSKVKKYKGLHDSIKDHLEDIIRSIHGSYETKDFLINQINEKFEDVSKKCLNTFFKEKCVKIKNESKQRKFWLVGNHTLNELNLTSDKLNEIKSEHFKLFLEKEERKQKELEEIKIKNGMNINNTNNTEGKGNNEEGKSNGDIKSISKSNKSRNKTKGTSSTGGAGIKKRFISFKRRRDKESGGNKNISEKNDTGNKKQGENNLIQEMIKRMKENAKNEQNEVNKSVEKNKDSIKNDNIVTIVESIKNIQNEEKDKINNNTEVKENNNEIIKENQNKNEKEDKINFSGDDIMICLNEEDDEDNLINKKIKENKNKKSRRKNKDKKNNDGRRVKSEHKIKESKKDKKEGINDPISERKNKKRKRDEKDKDKDNKAAFQKEGEGEYSKDNKNFNEEEEKNQNENNKKRKISNNKRKSRTTKDKNKERSKSCKNKTKSNKKNEKSKINKKRGVTKTPKKNGKKVETELKEIKEVKEDEDIKSDFKSENQNKDKEKNGSKFSSGKKSKNGKESKFREKPLKSMNIMECFGGAEKSDNKVFSLENKKDKNKINESNKTIDMFFGKISQNSNSK